MSVVTVEKNTYTAEPLYQWDLNQVLEVRGLSLASVPEVHFCHADMCRAIVRQATMDAAGVIRAEVPNSLLQKPYKLQAFICTYEGSTFQTLYKIEIPVKERAKPADYTLEDDPEVYSFNALENSVANAMAALENAMAALENAPVAPHNHEGAEIKPSAIELNPGTAASHGGYIDFHFKGSASDYTARLMETSAGVLALNNRKVLTSGNVFGVYSAPVTFNAGKASYADSRITESSVVIVQRRSDAVDAERSFTTHSNAGSVNIRTSSDFSGAINLNIIIVNN